MSASTTVATRERIRRSSVLHVLTERPVLIVFLVALVVRLAAGLVIARLFEGGLTVDDDLFHVMGTSMALDATEGWDTFTRWLYWHTATFSVPLTLVYELAPVEAAGRIYVALLGAGAAAAVTRLALTIVSARWALATGALMALLPSQVVWSAVILKDPAVWLWVALLTLSVVAFNRTEGRWFWISAAAVATSLLLLGYVRQHTMLVATYALVLAAFFGSRRQKAQRISFAVAALVVLPWLAGLGPGGYTFVTNAGSLHELRLNQAKGANTAFIDVPRSIPPPRQETGTGAVIGLDGWGWASAHEEIGEVASEAKPPEGDREQPEDPAFRDSGGEFTRNAIHLPRGMFVMLFEPLPWESGGSAGLQLARVENVLWYTLMAFAVLGLWAARKHLSTLAFPVIFMVGTLLVYALSEGNIGTAYRHRSEFAWVVILLATLGAARLAQKRRVRDPS